MGPIEIADAAERVDVWQCIGCGKIEEARPCIGVCQDRRASFVRADAFDATRAELNTMRERIAALEAFVRRLAHTRPHDAQWERSFRALQAQAAQLLERHAARDR